jgi:hypothetical protein
MASWQNVRNEPIRTATCDFNKMILTGWGRLTSRNCEGRSGFGRMIRFVIVLERYTLQKVIVFHKKRKFLSDSVDLSRESPSRKPSIATRGRPSQSE